MAIKTALAGALAAIASTISTAFGQIVPGGAPAYQQAGKLEARIISFSAEPASIQPGQPVTLRWAAENGQGPTIDQGIGPVTPRGSLRLNPKASTTYTFTVRGTNGTLTKDVTVTVAGSAPMTAGASAEAAKKDVPRAPDGRPDLSGVYNFHSEAVAVAAPAPATDGIATNANSANPAPKSSRLSALPMTPA